VAAAVSAVVGLQESGDESVMKAVMQVTRLFRHLIVPGWWVLRDFPKPLLRDIEQAIAASEARHGGELRFVVEANMPVHGLLRGQSPRARAIELFSQLRVWDTERNSGVLIYLQLLDRRVEIVADRGIDARVGQPFWSEVCRRMEEAFRARRFEAGTLAALAEISAALSQHFPGSSSDTNELPDAPLLL
jgi:uncharacterized membrane protein